MQRLIGLTTALAIALGVFASGLSGTAEADDKVVGYFLIEETTLEGGGVSYMVPPITQSGNEPLRLDNLSQSSLNRIDVLFLLQGDNNVYSDELLDAVDRIASWVRNGGELILHDRKVEDAHEILPGGANFEIVSDFDDDQEIQIIDDSTLVTRGPGGRLTDNSLDGGDSSSHGFTVRGSVPSSGDFIFSRTVASELVTFSYCYGDGGVIYSTIPLDYYLGGESNEEPVATNMIEIYAPNVVAYGASDFCGGGGGSEDDRNRFLGGGVVGAFPAAADAARANRERANAAGAAAAAAASAPAPTTTTVRPPSTGDGGLLDNSQGSSYLPTGALLALGLLGSGLAVARLRRS